MNDNNAHVNQAEPLAQTLPECLKPGKIRFSPLGWSIKERLLGVAAAAVLLWLSVVWAIGWL